MSTILDFKDIIATLIFVAALVILAIFHDVAWADIRDIVIMIATFWFARSSVAFGLRYQQPTPPVLAPPQEHEHEEVKA